MISVIVPIYKNEVFLPKCIDSIVNQTYKDLEIILVNDGSPDNCGLICDEYSKKDSRIRVIHKENGGRSSARNAGLAIAKGEYFAFVDSDDWVDSDMYENLIRVANETNADITECSYRYFRPWKTENKILENNDTNNVWEFTNEQALEKLYFGPQTLSIISISVCNKLYRTSCLGDVRFIEGYFHAEDVNYTPRVLFMANKVAKLDRTFYTYNIHLGTDSTSGSEITASKIWSGIFMRQKIADFFECNQLKRITGHTFHIYCNSLIDGYYECYIRKTNKEHKKLMAHIKIELYKIKEKMLSSKSIRYKIFFTSSIMYVALTWTKRF